MQSFWKCKVWSVTLFCGTVDGRNPAQCKYRYTMIYNNTAMCSIQYARNPAPQCDCPCQLMQDSSINTTMQLPIPPFCHGHRQRRSKRSIGHGKRFTRKLVTAIFLDVEYENLGKCYHYMNTIHLCSSSWLPTNQTIEQEPWKLFHGFKYLPCSFNNRSSKSRLTIIVSYHQIGGVRADSHCKPWCHSASQQIYSSSHYGNAGRWWSASPFNELAL